MKYIAEVLLEKIEVRQTTHNLKQKFCSNLIHKNKIEFFCPKLPLSPNAQFGVAKYLPTPKRFIPFKLDLLYKKPKLHQVLASPYHFSNFPSELGIDLLSSRYSSNLLYSQLTLTLLESTNNFEEEEKKKHFL